MFGRSTSLVVVVLLVIVSMHEEEEAEAEEEEEEEEEEDERSTSGTIYAKCTLPIDRPRWRTSSNLLVIVEKERKGK